MKGSSPADMVQAQQDDCAERWCPEGSDVSSPVTWAPEHNVRRPAGSSLAMASRALA